MTWSRELNTYLTTSLSDIKVNRTTARKYIAGLIMSILPAKRLVSATLPPVPEESSPIYHD